eukprot:gnl/TRDRNA2_/TRDRNA2_42709_c0_seq1.p1 gnl/TRDRNA2_/TRDRNA2_42709_c0~~gnl/TRDRNA2_/TRDRNA2_42709_c0_seq1.p1  ORF type:complete len:143 (+),score=30.44 gnl/TRDRNA2_/TRDRNA2_42709_c0_seq1:59-487(+)
MYLPSLLSLLLLAAPASAALLVRAGSRGAQLTAGPPLAEAAAEVGNLVAALKKVSDFKAKDSSFCSEQKANMEEQVREAAYTLKREKDKLEGLAKEVDRCGARCSSSLHSRVGFALDDVEYPKSTANSVMDKARFLRNHCGA